MNGVANYIAMNLNRTSACGFQGHRTMNISAIALSIIIIVAQIIVRAASHIQLGSLYIIFLTLTLIASILIICVAIYNLFHLRATVQHSREEQERLYQHIQDLEVVETELNRQLQEQKMELDCLREETVSQLERAQHIEGRCVEDLHRFEAEKEYLEQQLLVMKGEVVNLSRELESRLADASMDIEMPSSNEEEDDHADWFEANNVIGSPESGIAYMVVEDNNADDEESLSSKDEFSR
ncbi:conserved hypothetical protein [Chlamydia psittaci 01DC12]|uniref:hypothetical protein n=1 Tax=Chlamydia psittaci TaxID=83554 RepID=UPI0002970A96|nr:conserved hypothetical protein [Chlamydia psittaci 01DC12]